MKTYKTIGFSLILSSILVIIGCSSNDNPQITPATDKISKIIVDRGNPITFSYPQREVISTQELLDAEIADLQEHADAISSDTNEYKRQVLSWIQTLKRANIDFDKEHVLIYTFEEGARCKYTERTLFKNSQKAEIIFSKVRPECDSVMTYYYLAYRVSKEIKKVGIQAFEQKYVEMDME